MSFFFNNDPERDVEDAAYEAFKNAENPAIFLTAMVSETMKQVCLKQMKNIHMMDPSLTPEEAVELTDMGILAETVKIILMMASAIDYNVELDLDAGLAEKAADQMEAYVEELRTILMQDKKGPENDTNNYR